MASVSCAEVRSKLIQALHLDLIGPTPQDPDYTHEILPQDPSKWYLTGFLVPYGAPPDIRSDDTVDDELESLANSETSEDSQLTDKAPARKAWFPSSMGLSFLTKPTTQTITATLTWGDYLPLEPDPSPDTPEDTESDSSEKKRKPDRWQRIPQSATLEIPILIQHGSPNHYDIPNGSGLQLVIICRPVNAQSFPVGTCSVSCFVVNYRPQSPQKQRR